MKYIIIPVIIAVCSISFLSCSTKNNPDQLNQEEVMKAEAPDSLKTAQTAMDKYEPGTWLTDYNLALRLSKESGKPVLINFTGSDWCPWCFRLRDEVFSQDAFINFAKENLILLMIDFLCVKNCLQNKLKLTKLCKKNMGLKAIPLLSQLMQKEKKQHALAIKKAALKVMWLI